MNRTLNCMLVAFVAASLVSMPASAQTSDTMPKINMEIGTPVRVVARDTSQTIIGTFARQAADTFVLHRAAGAADTTLFLRNVLHVDEQAHPLNTHATRQGAIVGSVIGLAAGIVILRQARIYCENDLVLRPDGCGFAYALLPDFVAAGAGLGFGLAWVSEKPRWQLRWSAPLP